jgi:diketogulonate reductase-like aldo/keto reductase
MSDQKVANVQLPSGDNVPILGFGTFLSEPGKVGAAVRTALQTGYRHIDCAKVYGNEKEIGVVFAEVFNDPNSGITRQDVFITSKLPPASATSAENVRAALESTLADLKLDYLDLYLVHQPVPVVPNPNYDGKHRIIGKFLPCRNGFGLQDLWRAMEACHEAKLARNIGVSNYNTLAMNDLLNYARVQPAMNQIERHPYLTQPIHVPFCLANNVAVTAYAPLGAPGSYGTAETEPLLSHPVVSGIATKYGKTTAQVLIRWNIDSGVIVIPKSVTPSRIQENFNVLDFALEEAEVASVNALNRNGRMFLQDWHGVPIFS